MLSFRAFCWDYTSGLGTMAWVLFLEDSKTRANSAQPCTPIQCHCNSNEAKKSTNGQIYDNVSVTRQTGKWGERSPASWVKSLINNTVAAFSCRTPKANDVGDNSWHSYYELQLRSRTRNATIGYWLDAPVVRTVDALSRHIGTQ